MVFTESGVNEVGVFGFRFRFSLEDWFCKGITIGEGIVTSGCLGAVDCLFHNRVAGWQGWSVLLRLACCCFGMLEDVWLSMGALPPPFSFPVSGFLPSPHMVHDPTSGLCEERGSMEQRWMLVVVSNSHVFSSSTRYWKRMPNSSR